MKKEPAAQAVKSTPVLLIFAALCALFGSGAIIGITILSNPTLAGILLRELLPKYVVCFAILFFLVFGYGSIYPPVAYLTLPILCLACGVRTTFASAAFVNSLAIALIFAVLSIASIAFCMWAWKTYPMPLKKPHKALPDVLAILGMVAASVLSLAIFAVILHGRLDSLQAGDTAQAQLGQMLYYLQHSGRPFTTLLAGTPQSYFLTQFAPLWYLLLPVYVLFGHSMLAVGIALYALMLSALIPLWRICKKLSLSSLQSAAICMALATCPLLIGGASAGGVLGMLSLPLLLWVADALMGKRPYLALIPLSLCLCIGFEVTVWTVFFCLFFAMSVKRESRRAGLVCTAVSACALIATVIYLAAVQSPVLTGLFAGIGLQLGPKLMFALLLLLPFVFLPLLCKQIWALVLLIPYVLFHLIADASVFSGSFCSYAYPAIAAVALLAAHGATHLHVACKGVKLSYLLSTAALCVSLLVATPYAATLHYLYATPTEQERTDTDCIHELLDSLPQNASITASDSLLCDLHDRTWLFPLSQSPEQPQTNVIVLDLREDAVPSDMEQYTVAYYQRMGYTLRDDLSRQGLLAVLFK